MSAEAAVHIVEDLEDSRELVELIGAISNRLAGRVALHPTPGAAGRVQLASDLLVSLGKRFDALASERVRAKARDLVDVWVEAERVRHLFVLRAHLLAPGRWRDLLGLGRRRGIETWFIVHPTAPAWLDGVLAGAPYRRWCPASFAARWRDVAAQGDGEPRRMSFPEVPADDFLTFRAAARRLLDGADFEHLDQTFCESMDRTDGALGAWKRRVRMSPPPPLELADVSAQLQALLVTCSGPPEALTRLRGAQAAYFRAGWLVSFQPPLVPTGASVPLGPRLDSAAAARLRRLCTPRSTSAMALFLAAEFRSLGLSRLNLGDIDDTGGDLAVGRRGLLVPEYASSLVRAQLVERRRDGASASEPLFVHARSGERSSPSALRNVLRSVSGRTAIAVGVHDALSSPRDITESVRGWRVELSQLNPVPLVFR